ncbi:MAG: trigger factor [Thermoleophilia bacterium]
MPLTADVTPLEENRVRLDVAVPEDEVQREIDRTVRKLGREVRIPGFRPGKVPATVVVQRLGREVVVQEMLKEALDRWYSKAVEESGVQPIDDPDVDLEDVPSEGELTFQATVRVRPKATLGEYLGLEVGRAEPEVPEGALEQQLEAFRQRAARLEAVDRAAATGDFLVIDFDGSIAGRRLKSAGARDYSVELGGGRLLPEFERALTGASAGDSVTFPVSYGEDDQRDELRGRTVDYTVTVKQVQQKVLPELDDDLALEVSEFDTIDELRADVQRRLDEAAQAQVDELYRRMIIDAVTKNATVDVPEVMVNRRIGTILGQTAQQLPEGVSLEDYLAAGGRNLAQVVDELRPDAEMALRRELVVEAVADAEDIQVTDEEIEAQVKEDAETTGRSLDRLMHELRHHGGWEPMRQDMRIRRAVDRLIEKTVAIPMAQAEAREKLWTPEEDRPGAATGESGIVTPKGMDAPAGKLWTPGDPR